MALPQHMQALNKANEIRLAQAALKREIRKGSKTVIGVITDPPDFVKGMSLGALLKSQPRFGHAKTRDLCYRLGISEMRRIGALTDRQKDVIVERFVRFHKNGKQ